MYEYQFVVLLPCLVSRPCIVFNISTFLLFLLRKIYPEKNFCEKKRGLAIHVH